MVNVARPEAVVFLITVAVIVTVGVIRRLTRGQIDERQDHLFPYVPAVYGIVVAALSRCSWHRSCRDWWGRVVAEGWHRGHHKPA